jgi:hypothetical protein
MFLAGAATHVILVTVRPGSYNAFADGSWWSFVTHAWRSVLVPNVYYLIPLLAAYEFAVGLLILSQAHRRIGIAAAVAFNATLLLFGWGFCLWSVPVIAALLRFGYLEVLRSWRGTSERPWPASATPGHPAGTEGRSGERDDRTDDTAPGAISGREH